MTMLRATAIVTWIYAAGFGLSTIPVAIYLRQRGVMLIVAWTAWLVWNASTTGAILALALIAIEIVFWIGFALPIPWLLGAARVVLLLLGWKSLSRG